MIRLRRRAVLGARSLGGSVTLAAAEEESDSLSEAHGVLVPLGWSDDLGLDLTHIRAKCVAETALAVRLDLSARRWLAGTRQAARTALG